MERRGEKIERERVARVEVNNCSLEMDKNNRKLCIVTKSTYHLNASCVCSSH